MNLVNMRLADHPHPGKGNLAALADVIHAETSGNPFFAEEMVRHLRDAGCPGRAARSRRRPWLPLGAAGWELGKPGAGGGGRPAAVLAGRRLPRGRAAN